MLTRTLSITLLLCITLSRASRASSNTTSSNSNSTSYLRGIDVSHYQGTINWNQVSKSGIKFACAKATEGETNVDPSFHANWIGMKSVGLTRCAYHFAHPKDDAVTQVKDFIFFSSLLPFTSLHFPSRLLYYTTVVSILLTSFVLFCSFCIARHNTLSPPWVSPRSTTPRHSN